MANEFIIRKGYKSLASSEVTGSLTLIGNYESIRALTINSTKGSGTEHYFRTHGVNGENLSLYSGGNRVFRVDSSGVDVEGTLDVSGNLTLSGYGAGYLKTDANGLISVDTSTIEDTLDSVTDRGATTTNAISTGNITANGSILGGGNLFLRSYNNDPKGIFFRDGFEYGDTNQYNLSITVYDDGDGSADGMNINAYDGIYFNVQSGTTPSTAFRVLNTEVRSYKNFISTGNITTTSTSTGAITLNGGTGVSTTGAFILRQNGNGADNGMAITSGHATSHRIWKDASGNLNIGSSGNADAFKQDISGNVTIEGDATITGTLTAQEFHTEFVSASIIFESGSTKFGDTSDDNHDFTGSLNLSGSATIEGPGAALSIKNSTNGGGALIQFTDQTAALQKGNITFYHSDGSSQGGGASFHFTSTEGADSPILVVGDSSSSSRIVVKSAANNAEVDYGFYDDQNTGMVRTSADNVSLVAGGVRGIGVGSTAVSLKYAGSTKLATSNTGVAVTGNGTFTGRVVIGDDAITTDKPGLVVGDTTNNGQITIRGGQPTLFFDKSGTNDAVILTDSVNLKFKNGTLDSEGSDQLTLDTSGNATFAGTVTANGTVLTGDQDLSGYVTLTGAQTISGAKTFSSTSNHYKGHFYYDAYDAAGNHYPHFLDGGDAGGTTVNWRQYYGSNQKTHTWTSDSSGNMVFTYQGAIKAVGELEGTSLDINGNVDIDQNLNAGAFLDHKNSNAGSNAYTSIRIQNDTGNAEIWRNSSTRTQTGGAAQSFNIYNTQDTNIWSGGTRALHLDTSQNATFAGTVSAEDNIHLTDAGTVRAKLLLNASDRDNVELRAESLGSTMKFFTVGTEALELDASQNATFAGAINLSSNKSVAWPGGSIRAEGNTLKLVATTLIDLQDNTKIQGDLTIEKSTPKLTFNNLAGGGLDPILEASGTDFNIKTTSVTPLSINLSTQAATFGGDVSVKSQLDVIDTDSTAAHVRAFSNATEGVLTLSNGSNWGLIMRGPANDPRIGAYHGGTLKIEGFHSSDGSTGANSHDFAQFQFGNDHFQMNAATSTFAGTVKAATSFIADAVSPSNNDPGTDNVQVSGYGMIGNRGNLYITNANTDSAANVQIGVGGVHNGSPKLSIGATVSTISTNLHPGADSTYNIGSNASRFANIYADTLYGDGSNLTNVTATSYTETDTLDTVVERGAVTDNNITVNSLLTNADSTYNIGSNAVRFSNGYFDALHTKGTIQNNTASYINYISNQGHRFYIDGNNDDTTHLFQILSNTNTYNANNVVATVSQLGNATFAGTVTATHFYGDGSNLTNVSATDSTKVSKTGDTMTGTLTIDGEGSNADKLLVKGSARIALENANATNSIYLANTGGNNQSILDIGGAVTVIEDGNVGIGIAEPIPKFHVYQNDTAVDTTAGITIEQDGTGDSALSFLLTATKRWRLGIDNSDSDKFKISDSTNLASSNRFTIDTSGNVGIGTTNPGSKLDVNGGATFAGDVTIGGSTGSTGNALAVNRGSDGAQALRVQNSGEVVTSANYLYAASSGTSLYVQNTAVFRGNILNDGGDVTIADNLTVNGNITIGGNKYNLTVNAPTNLVTSIVNDTINVTFTASTTSNIDNYLVFSSVAGGDYGLISVIPPADFGATMSIIDDSFNAGGTQAYRIYAVKNGVYSSALTGNKSFTVGTVEPTNLSVVNLNSAYYIQYDAPSSKARFVTAYNIYKHEHATQSSLDRSSATLIYSGMNNSYMYQINGSNNTNFHQFWVETTVA